MSQIPDHIQEHAYRIGLGRLCELCINHYMRMENCLDLEKACDNPIPKDPFQFLRLNTIQFMIEFEERGRMCRDNGSEEPLEVDTYLLNTGILFELCINHYLIMGDIYRDFCKETKTYHDLVDFLLTYSPKCIEEFQKDGRFEANVRP